MRCSGFTSIRTILAFGLCLSVSIPTAFGQSSPDTDEATDAMFTMPTMEERQTVFGPIDDAFRAGQKAKVADLLVEVVDNPIHTSFHAESYARLGAVLDELSLPYSALISYQKALKTDATAVSSVAKDAIRLADQVGDTALLESVFAANVGLDVDGATRSRMAYLAAREAHHQGNYSTALAILKMVQSSDPFYPESKALEGVVLAMQARHKDAIAPLLIAVSAGANAGRETRFEDLVHLNLARAYYGAENFGRAIEYYAKVSRSSDAWPQAQLERAWSHFRLTDINGTLGLLHTHVSPFMNEEYFPEAALLRVYSLFLMCKFPEATKQIENFKSQYEPQQAKLGIVAATSEEQLFDAMANHADTGRDDLLPPTLGYAFSTEDRFKDSLAAVRMAEDEMKRLENILANPFSAWASDQLGDRRAALRKVEGKRIQERAYDMEGRLGQMLNDAEMSKLDMLQFETRLYEQASHTGKVADARRVVDRKKRVKRGYQTWPFEGEYWGDEVGYYRISAKPECPTGMQSGVPTE